MSNLEGKRVLVTGADGFLPSYVCEKLVERGARVTALVRRNSSCILKNIGHLTNDLDVVWGDITDFSSMVRLTEDIEIIYHLAANSHVAYSIVQPAESFQIQTMGTLNILEAARLTGVERIIHAGSAEVYGVTEDMRIPETAPLLPRSAYAAGKVAADRLMYAYWCSYGTPVVMPRFFGIYGPRQSLEKAIPKFIRNARSGEPIPIYGDGTQTRDFMFGSDAAEAYAELGVADGVIGKPINIGTGVKYPIISVARDILRVLKSDTPIEMDMNLKQGEASHLVADPTFLKTVLQWQPRVTWEEGLERTVRYFVDQRWDEACVVGRV